MRKVYFRGGYAGFSGLSILLGMLVLFSCKVKPGTSSMEPYQSAVNAYSNLVYDTYTEVLNRSIELQSAINEFIQDPDSIKMQVAKNKWIYAREKYAQTEVFRFYDGPIDNGSSGVEDLLNAWPLDEVYVDYVEGNNNSGIINNIINYPEITKDLLISMNQNGGEENISTGFHAIEFLLWGQDLNSNGPGKRSFKDYLANAKNADRRKSYLKISIDLIIEQLSYLKQQWEIDKLDNYRTLFIQSAPNIALQKILTGMATLSKVEMAGERMFTAYDNADQEDEQSCFSDNTKADLVNNLAGIKNVFYGEYKESDSAKYNITSIGELVKNKDEDLYRETDLLIKKCTSDLKLIHQPFDQALILEDKRPQVLEAVMSMQKLGDQFSKVAEVLGLSINVNAVN